MKHFSPLLLTAMLLRRRCCLAPAVQQSSDISFQPGPQQQTPCTLLQQSTAGTDRQTDTRTVTQILLHTVKQYQRCWFKQISVITFAFRCSSSAAGAFRRIAIGHWCFARAAGFVCDRLVTTNMSHFRSIF